VRGFPQLTIGKMPGRGFARKGEGPGDLTGQAGPHILRPVTGL